MYKYVILGAGPAGLALAGQLKRSGETNFIVVEKEAEAGGLCRSVKVDGSAFDIGGGHFLDVRRPRVNEFLFSFMPEDEWELFERDSRIDVNGYIIGHPFESNIWQFPIEHQVEYLESIAKAGCNSEQPMPERFVEWIRWKLGNKIAEDYMIPYNMKMFADDLGLLGTYWLEKLPNVSFRETLLSSLNQKAYGTQPGHAQFFYPKQYGYGEVWLRIADYLKEQINFKKEVITIDFNSNIVTCLDGTEYQGETIITTIPWICFKELIGMPEAIRDSIKELKYSSIETRYCPDCLDTEAQWIYYPDISLPYHRILVRHNFCRGSKGYWMETRGERVSSYADFENGRHNNAFAYKNEYAYPINTVDKPMIMEKVLTYAKEHNVYGLGRWGEHNHYNSDVTVECALNLANELMSMPSL